MNPTKENLPHDERNPFDRLVDGELSESERRALLASLDFEPAGWRRCALAFLEAQTWRESFGEITHRVRKSSVLPPAPFVSSPPQSKRKKPLGALGTVMAMAASFLLTLGVGSWVLKEPPRGKTVVPPPEYIAGVNPPAAAVLTTPPDLSAGAVQPAKPSTSTPWRLVQLKAPGLTGDNETLQLPAVERDRLDDDFLKTVPNPLPNAVLQAWKRTGHEVHTYRELVPVQLKDGRRLIVPIDQVEVQYDGHRAY